jgi:hypothetical protein
MVPSRTIASTSAATVTMLIKPKMAKSSSPTGTPTPASAMGMASIPPPTVSVSVTENAIQKGGIVSSRSETRARHQRNRSRQSMSDTNAVEISRFCWRWNACLTASVSTASVARIRGTRS